MSAAKSNTTVATAAKTPSNNGVYVAPTNTVSKPVSAGVLEVRRKNLAKEYRDGKKVTITGSPFYRPYFGKVMPIIINGIAVHVPMDGTSYEIPEAFAEVFYERIHRVDALVKTQREMSEATSNLEAYPGERSLIKSV